MRYLFSHFGSDTSGVNTARRYLCEALSFQYRYVPIGLLEVPTPTSATMGTFTSMFSLISLLLALTLVLNMVFYQEIQS